MTDDTAPHPPGRFEWQRAVRDDRRLSMKAKALCWVLLSYFDTAMSWDQVDVPTLMLDMGIKDAHTFYAASAEATDAGYLIVKRQRRGSNLYRAALPRTAEKPHVLSGQEVRFQRTKTCDETPDQVLTDHTDQELTTPPEAEDMTEAVQLPMLATLDGGKLPATRQQTPNQRANTLARIYSDAEPLSHFMATRGIVARAVKAGYSDEQIRAALLQIVAEGRPLTVGTLRYRLNPPKQRSTTDERMAKAIEAGRRVGKRLGAS